MKKSTKMAQSIVGTSKGRPKHDFYPTPEYVTQDLIDREKFVGTVWEPACGMGDMSEVLLSNGLYVYSSDLVDYGYGDGVGDFLLLDKKFDNVITNPPFKLAQEFVLHALECVKYKVAIFAKLAFLEGQRRKEMFMNTPLKRVYVYSKRVTLTRNGEKQRSTGMIAFAWYVWEKGYSGNPLIDWI